MAIHLTQENYLCDTCKCSIKKDTIPYQICLPKINGTLILKFDTWNCLAAFVMKKIMDNWTAQQEMNKEIEKIEG